ncbi:hypothetical protein P7I17_gp15 [Escherichia phage Halfdan]|uniref:Uncharacterized protein n=1 Tax=Escherichia phage Halfdan TaxID=2234092 RepID=A0A2Z5H398_9CAUD|nr:hypothetical protein P7I17_gp15 [Escherichia phage Halfdan]AXC34269.1 hypothetical protein [Escherichia phage Halfdan]
MKVLFFTAGAVPTTDERNAIAAIVAGNVDILVRNGAANAEYGADRLEPCDYVFDNANIPDAYADVPTTDNPHIPANGAIVTDGQALNVSNSAGDAFVASAIHVADGVAQWTNLPATHALAVSGELTGIAATGTGTKVTLTVTDGKISAVALSA